MRIPSAPLALFTLLALCTLLALLALLSLLSLLALLALRYEGRYEGTDEAPSVSTHSLTFTRARVTIATAKMWQPLARRIRLTVVKSVGSPMGVTHDA